MILTAMLLAGGHARRMGKDKATLSIGGELLWRRQLRLLEALPGAEVWVSARTRPAWCPAAIKFVADSPPSRGPLSGLAAGLDRLKTTHLLVLAIDLPRMCVEHLRRLWTSARPGMGVIPWQHDYFEPLCAIYPAEAAPLARERLMHSDASLQRLAHELLQESLVDKYVLSPEEAGFYLNVNRPSDLPASALEGPA